MTKKTNIIDFDAHVSFATRARLWLIERDAFIGPPEAYEERCRECSQYGEKGWAKYWWIPGQPDTAWTDCERCKARDPVAGFMYRQNKVKKLLKKIQTDLRKIAHLLSPLQKQVIVNDLDEARQAVLALLEELARQRRGGS
jgi:hypothetical protein